MNFCHQTVKPTVYAASVFLLVIFAQARYPTVEFSGNNFFSSRYLTQNYLPITNKEDVENLINSILVKYGGAGFPFCRIAPELVSGPTGTEKIILKITEGERVIIRDYLYEIAGKTDVTAIERFVRLKRNTYFSTHELSRAKMNLMSTGVFQAIDAKIVRRDADYYVLFGITEKRSDYVNALGSFAEDNYNFGFVFYSLNLLGTLRRFEFNYEYQKQFSLRLTEPVLIAPAIFDLDFSIWTYDSARLTQFRAQFTAPLGRYLSMRLLTGLETTLHLYNSENQQHVDNIVGLGIGYELAKSEWHCRQDLSLEYLFRTYDRWTVKYDGELRMFGVNVRPHYRRVVTDSLEYLDLVRIGGAKSMRGYLEDEFLVQRATWLNVEYDKFFLFPILDLGLVETEFILSYGFGLRAQSTLADATISFVWPKQGRWRDGKVHLLFARGF